MPWHWVQLYFLSSASAFAASAAATGLSVASVTPMLPNNVIRYLFMNALRSVDVVRGVVNIELTGRRNQLRVLDHSLELARLVIDDDDRRLLVLGAPHREPYFVSGLVVLGMHDPLRAFAHLGPFGDRQNFRRLVEIADVVHGHRLADFRVRVQRGIHPEILGFGMGLDEKRSAALALQRLHHL